MGKGLRKSGFFVVAAIIFVIALLLAREGLVLAANGRADNLLQSRRSATSVDDDIALIASLYAARFEPRESGFPLLWRLRPYLTNALLPGFIRLPEGAIETLYPMGWCDNAARGLKFVLAHGGYQSVQWNMMTPESAHSALSVSLPDGRRGLVDPFYQLAGWRDGRLVSAEDVQSALRSGKPRSATMKALGARYRPDFYDNIAMGFMGASGDKVRIAVTLPDLNDVIEIGKRDGDADDVSSAAMALGLTPYWHYLGHRYSREWTRSFSAMRPVQVTFYLTESLLSEVFPALATPPESVDDKMIVWAIKPGRPLVIEDGRARRSFTKMRSYSPVDQIVITPLAP
ncbi:MAG: hypothetical protein HYU57_04450 [Micavibrio aeruginosavorus]|nr:hypothetical protein [Micavibrio aeruginosavorus]